MGQDTPPQDPAAGPDDLTRIARLGPEASELFAALHIESFNAPWPAEDFERLLASSGVIGLVLETSGEPAGLALIRTVAGECEILTIGIARAVRRGGLGRQLLTACEGAAREAGARRIFLEVSEANAAGQALYKAAGYAAVGRRKAYYRDGSDARVLARNL